MNLAPAVVASGFALLTMIVASSPNAEAHFKRQHISACIETSALHQYTISGSLLLNLDTNIHDGIFCALPEDHGLPKAQVSTLTVSGVDNSTLASTFARACIANVGGDGGQCDEFVTTGNAFTGTFTLSPPHTTWSRAHRLDFAYLELDIPPLETITSTPSGLSGFLAADDAG